MHYVYADNYRGFSDTILELKKVNYFVGENSTGKTSIMTAISLLSEPDFWFKQDFNAAPFRLGYFNDLVSKKSENKRYFTLGSISFHGGIANGNMFKYCKRGNKPTIKEIMVIGGRKIIHTKLTNKKMFIRHDSISRNLKKEIDVVKYIADSFNGSASGFKSVSSQYPLLGRNTPYMLTLLYSSIKENTDISKPVAFEMHGVSPFKWVAPIRTKPKSIYENLDINYSPEGDHTPVILNKMLNKEREDSLVKLIETFGRESGLFHKIRTRNFGKKSNAPFEIRVTLNESEFGLNKVGYGVSQILPIIVDLLSSKNQNYAIQQPEVHLHPKAQAQLGELIYSISTHKDCFLLIETHSDYLIDRFRLEHARKKEKVDSQVVFFERTNNGNEIHCIEIDENGRYQADQPVGFRNFFLNEQIALLEI